VKRRHKNEFFAGLAILLAVTPGQAHHGANTDFDQTGSIELSGTITDIRWVNPHSFVYFDVAALDGGVEHWRCELRAAAMLKRSGWSKTMFEPGTRIDIEGAPSRHDDKSCYVRTLRLDGGEPVQRYAQLVDSDEQPGPATGDRPARLPDGQLNISGSWAAPQQLLQESERERRGPSGFREVDYVQSPTGKAASANFDAARDDPRLHCEAVNILSDWIEDQQVNRIDQSDDTITLTYGFMDTVRVIHLGMESHPAGLEPSRVGHSIGHWRGNTLVVDTIGFAPGYLDGHFGIMHSERLHVVEEFNFDPDRLVIVRSYTGEDPLYLAAPFASRDAVFLTDTSYEPYDCADLTSASDPAITVPAP